MLLDVNAWLGQWPFRALRDNTPQTLLARLDRCGIDAAAVSPIEAVFHRNVQPAVMVHIQCRERATVAGVVQA